MTLTNLEKELRYNQIAESALNVQGYTKFKQAPIHIQQAIHDNVGHADEHELDFEGVDYELRQS